MGEQVLLVEGRADMSFYQAFCRVTKHTKIEVKPPRSIGAPVDSKTNAIHYLPFLLHQLDDGSVSHLGLVVDADYQQEHGLGFAMTLGKVRDKMLEHGFRTETRINTGGFIFEHPDGLPSVGLWIMPDNRNEGMLEDFIKSTISREQSALYVAACRAVDGLTDRLFKQIHQSKAEVATWLAWQRIPGAPLENVIGSELIEITSTTCQQLNDWLEVVF